jgi:hypothetical protein
MKGNVYGMESINAAGARNICAFDSFDGRCFVWQSIIVESRDRRFLVHSVLCVCCDAVVLLADDTRIIIMLFLRILS